jgi:hypothetical protein
MEVQMRDRADPGNKVHRLAQFRSTKTTQRPVLCIDLLPEQLSTVQAFMPASETLFAPLHYGGLSDLAQDKYRPELVIAPLFSESFDVVDVAETLAFAGYYGELWAVGPALPNPRLIERELREFAGTIAFRLITQQDTARTGTAN